jgi:GDP-L-fucose synthase
VWGTGTPRREFLFSEDLAEACIHLMNLPDEIFAGLLSKDAAPLVNIGTGIDITIRDLAELIARILDFRCEIVFDPTRQDGTPRKLLDVSRIHSLGWKARTGLEEGIKRVIEGYEARVQLEHR